MLALYEGGRIKVVGPELHAAIDECIKAQEPNYTGNLRMLEAQTYLEQNRVDDAIKVLKEHYDEIKAQRNPRATAKCNALLANAYRKKGLPALAQLFATYVT